MITEIITIVANIALALSFVVALIFGIAQVKSVERDRKERLTLEALRAFGTRDFAELMQFIISGHMPKTRDELNALPMEQLVMFTQFAQQMESVGILVVDGYIDLDLVDKTLGSLVTMAWKQYKPLFVVMREQDPFIGEYFQVLAEQVYDRLKNNPRDPVYTK